MSENFLTILSLVNFIGGNTQFTAAGYMPSSSDKDASPTSPGGALESDQLAVDLCGLTTPRKTSQCQHVIAREKELVYRGAENGPEFAGKEILSFRKQTKEEIKKSTRLLIWKC